MAKQTYNLVATIREKLGKQVKQLRENGQIPVVLYGHDTDNVALTLDAKAFRRVYREAGTNSLVTLNYGDATAQVLVQDVQEHPVTGDPVHVDLYAVNMKETVQTEVPLSFEGTAPAVKDLSGNFIANLHEIEVESLPTDIPHEIVVDIAVLATFEDAIRAKDLKLPANVTLITDPEETIAYVEEPRSEEELEAELADTSAEEAAAVEELGKEAEKPEGEEGEAVDGEAKSDGDEKKE